MIHVKIQGKEIRNEEEFHNFLKKELNFPDYYGENLNALWDCLKNIAGKKLIIEWFDFLESKRKFTTYEDGSNEAEMLVSIFKNAGKELLDGNFELIIHE